GPVGRVDAPLPGPRGHAGHDPRRPAARRPGGDAGPRASPGPVATAATGTALVGRAAAAVDDEPGAPRDPGGDGRLRLPVRAARRPVRVRGVRPGPATAAAPGTRPSVRRDRGH